MLPDARHRKGIVVRRAAGYHRATRVAEHAHYLGVAGEGHGELGGGSGEMRSGSGEIGRGCGGNGRRLWRAKGDVIRLGAVKNRYPVTQKSTQNCRFVGGRKSRKCYVQLHFYPLPKKVCSPKS